MTATATAHDVLAMAAAIIADNGWTRGALARGAKGGRADPLDARGACKWCAVGAIRRAAYELTSPDGGEPNFGAMCAMENKAVSLLQKYLDISFDIPHWNDYSALDGAYVVAKMREAAAAAV